MPETQEPVEPVLVGYVTDQEYIAYATARGYEIDEDRVTINLTLALDWIERQCYSGRKTDPEQVLQFPRNGSITVPNDIKTAQIEAALIYDGGGDLFAPITQSVKKEKVSVIEVEYQDNSSGTIFYPNLMTLLRPFLCGFNNGVNFKTCRGL